ncbi:MAG: cyclic nucleotide-binding domain-containing protein [Moraxellaceae bacterium]|nr:cyclic nucleotide-binding domain-containing protein [Pseudobdellovibrionaceae bacterium]
MKIESEVFNFNKIFNSNSLALNDLQKQYLTYLTSGDSIEQLVVRLLNNGWLINFQELYFLVEKLVKNGALLNQNLIHYFKHAATLHTATSSRASLVESSAPQKDMIQKILDLPFFRSLPRDLALVLIQKSALRKYSAEAVICKTGDRDRNMYVLLTGEAAIYKTSTTGRQFISVISKNGIFGEASFLTGAAKSADVISTQTCDVLVVPYQPEILDPLLNQSVVHQITKRFWIQNALSHSVFFKKIPADCLDALTFTGKILTLQNDQILFKQNDQSLSAYLVIQGQLKVVQNSKIISNLIQGSFFGEISLTMTNEVRTASVFSNGPSTLLEINRNDFYLLLSQNLFLAKEIQNLAYLRLKEDQQR